MIEKILKTVGESTKAAADMSNLDLNKRKLAAQESIAEIDKPIIIFIDDIDRLPPAEIRTIIQVIKAIANFNRVSYLLAFEPEPVIKSLEYNGTYDGRRYLEKIVQAAYPIPRIGYWHLKGFLRNHLTSLLSKMEFVLNEVDGQLLNEALDSTAIIRALSTPRDVIRLTNLLKITAKNTWGEVNFADMLAFETLELKYPEISAAIRNNPELFLKKSILEGDYIVQDHLDDMVEDSKSGEEPEFMKVLLANYESLDLKNIRSILSFIFPTLLGKWDYVSPEESVINNRICTTEPLLKLLHSGPNKYIFSREEVRHFLGTDTDRKEILLDYLQSGSIPGWLRYANQFVKTSDISNPLSLCTKFLEISRIAFKEFHQNITNDISSLLRSIIFKCDNKNEILRFIVSNEISLSVSENIILYLLSEYDLWDSGTYKGPRDYTADELKKFPLPPHDIINAKNNWLDTVRKVIPQADIFKNEPQPISILFRWGQLNENNFIEVQNYLEDVANNDVDLALFLECFHEGKGLSGTEMLIKDVPIFISRIESLANPPSSADKIVSYLKQLKVAEHRLIDA